MSQSDQYRQKVAHLMLNRLSQRNILQQRIESGSFSAPARWTKTIENVDFDFPRLTIEDLRFQFFGTYKIKIAKSYVEEHQEPDGDYMIEFGDTNDNILRCRIQSRHSNATKHKAWIQYSTTGDPIVAWYCTCSAVQLKYDAIRMLPRLFGTYHMAATSITNSLQLDVVFVKPY